MSCEVGGATEGLENELWRRWSDGKVGEWAELLHVRWADLILQHFRHFTYVTSHPPTLPSFYLCHNSFSNHSVASPTSQLILQSFFRFFYVSGSSLTSLGEPPMQNTGIAAVAPLNKPLTSIQPDIIHTLVDMFLVSQDQCSSVLWIHFRDGAVCGGVQLPVSPLDENSDWRCDRCPAILSSAEVTDIVGRIGDDVDSIQAVSYRFNVTISALLILQPSRRFTYVTAHSPTLPSLYLRHSSLSNPSFAFPTSQALHLRHLASRLWLS